MIGWWVMCEIRGPERGPYCCQGKRRVKVAQEEGVCLGPITLAAHVGIHAQVTNGQCVFKSGVPGRSRAVKL